MAVQRFGISICVHPLPKHTGEVANFAIYSEINKHCEAGILKTG